MEEEIIAGQELLKEEGKGGVLARQSGGLSRKVGGHGFGGKSRRNRVQVGASVSP
jgi:hypothetical protein